MKYAIYVKFPEAKRAYPLSGQGITKKLIYAEMWDSLEIAHKACESLTAQNDGMTFEVRKV